jgi:LPXTG-motif cell wall-anchored protein
MTQTGNVNTAQLTYSNNPNETATPDSTNTDKPGPGAPTGQTPQIKTVTYVTQIDILKTKADGSTPLAGATFTLDGYLKTAVASSGEYFVKTDGSEATGTETYYRLNDGTYKLVSEFVAGTDEYYDSTTTTYKKVAASAVPTTSKIHKEVTTTSDGKINFAGLGEGTYIITETAAPGGYNKLEQPITVVITATGVTITGCTWGKTVTDLNNATTAGDYVQGDATNASKLPMTIVNREGSTLPSTGGIGTKLFYLFGSLLVAGSVVLLVTKKRMAAKEN